ncbi:hypothetical protein H4R33_005927 [Dimargaris cristalligena]|nr:hypothetical protein H4R33_005927 [Dimargaris cristalligena]
MPPNNAATNTFASQAQQAAMIPPTRAGPTPTSTVPTGTDTAPSTSNLPGDSAEPLPGTSDNWHKPPTQSVYYMLVELTDSLHYLGDQIDYVIRLLRSHPVTSSRPPIPYRGLPPSDSFARYSPYPRNGRDRFNLVRADCEGGSSNHIPMAINASVNAAAS